MVNALLVQTEVLHLVTGETTLERGILFPDRKNLYIDVNNNGEVFVSLSSNNVVGRKILKEIQVPQIIVTKAENLLLAEKIMKSEYLSIVEILNT